MKNILRYVLIAIVVIVTYSIISPSSVGGWVLYFIIGFLLVGAVEVAYRRFVE